VVSSLTCANCKEEIKKIAFYLTIEWEDVGKETGIPIEESFSYIVCGVKCGVELLSRCIKEGKPLASAFVSKASMVKIYRRWVMG